MLIVIALLIIAVMGSAIGVIYSKHQTRKIFISLQQLHNETDELNIEWGQLQLEQSAWSSQARIEEIARTKLQMKLPRANEVFYIKQ